MAKDNLPWWRFDVADWLLSRSVRRMTRPERSLYFDLLCHCWQDGGIPDDLGEIAHLLHEPREVVEAAWTRIGPLFVPHPDRAGELVNERQHGERVKAANRVEQLREAGSRGGTQRASNEAQGKHAPKHELKHKLEHEPSTSLSVSSSSSPSNSLSNKNRGEEKREEHPTGVARGEDRPTRSNLDQLWEELPEGHRTQEVRDEMRAYFDMRKRLRLGELVAATISRRASELAQYTPDEVRRAFELSVLNEWHGLFPAKARREGRTRPWVETPEEMLARLDREDADVPA